MEIFFLKFINVLFFFKKVNKEIKLSNSLVDIQRWKYKSVFKVFSVALISKMCGLPLLKDNHSLNFL